jgi:hypothetical protein
MDCYRITAAVGDALRVRVVKVSGEFGPLMEVTRPNGTTLCGPTLGDDSTCTANTAGGHTILVRDMGPGTRTGEYTIAVSR